MSLPAYASSPLEAVDSVYDQLTARFASRATYDIDYRIYNLKQLAFLITDNRDAIAQAVHEDLDKGDTAVDMEELFPILNEIDLAVRKVRTWAKDEGRMWDAVTSFKPMRPKIKKQPRGVALIIGPWNYPWQCVLAPLVGAIAAGCPAVLKPSELAPASAALLAQLIPRYLDPDAYAVILGDVQHAEKLMEKQWGHVIFTGSGRVGKIVAGAAAKTLTPTTLELGGKSPVIITPCADMFKSVKRMLSVKQMGAGQMCDYVLCVEDRVDEFIQTCKNLLDKWHPPHPHPNSLLTAPSSAKLCTRAGYERQEAFLGEAEREGKIVIRGEADAASRRMGITVLRMNRGGEGEGNGVLKEEIFGPILPVIPVRDVDEAIAYINARPHPLALYLCATSSDVKRKMATQTISGSMTVNDFGLATINRTLPFGGVGDSGWGAYHGEEGFNTFTHRKAMLEVPLFIERFMGSRYPPLTEGKKKMMRQMFVVPLAFSRPTSVEGEKAARRRRKLIKWAGTVLVLLVGGWLSRNVGFKIGGWY